MENITQRTALIAGASGLIGNHCLRFLLEDETYSSVVALVRKSLPVKHQKLRQHIVNFDKLEDASVPEADDIFCCLGTTIKKAGSQTEFRKVDLDYPVRVAKLACQNGAKQFLIVTAIGANKSSLIFYNMVKGEVEEAVKKIPFQSVHIFRPSLLLGEREEKRAGEKAGTILFNLAAPLFIGPLKKYKAIEGRVVAGAMVQCAKKNAAGIHIHESNGIQKNFEGKF